LVSVLLPALKAALTPTPEVVYKELLDGPHPVHAPSRDGDSELLNVKADLDRVDRNGEFWSYPESRTFAELLIDCEEDRVLRAVLVGMLRENSR
jgi:hypothetical protein